MAKNARTGLLPAEKAALVEAIREYQRRIGAVTIAYHYNAPEYQAATRLHGEARTLAALLSDDPRVLDPKPFSSSGT